MSGTGYIFLGLTIAAVIQIISILGKDAKGICIVCGGSGINRYTGDKCTACMGKGRQPNWHPQRHKDTDMQRKDNPQVAPRPTNRGNRHEGKDTISKRCPKCGNTFGDYAYKCTKCDAVLETVPTNRGKLYSVEIKGPDDSKKTYFITKEFYKDIGVTFEKAKDFLSYGTTCNFKNKDEALKFVEKYKGMGCRVELNED